MSEKMQSQQLTEKQGTIKGAQASGTSREEHAACHSKNMLMHRARYQTGARAQCRQQAKQLHGITKTSFAVTALDGLPVLPLGHNILNEVDIIMQS
mmetsp:Transcript_25465/g.77353  ORF Transcript_25465/g.77353 Transcript_25465/m.77353 type:complete len:96 (+) Transcript_25465:672-959(+)|eukprot:scaffold174950_cov26-Tisochrysis_lutea.AAC.1